MEASFQEKMELIGARKAQVEAVLAQCTADEAEALKCIYALMQVGDAVEYAPEMFLGYAKHGVFLWYEGPFAGKVPEDIFVAYVLAHRLSSEDLTDCRAFFYNLLKEDITGMSMEEAVIALNYWCASQVTYQSTDGRTAGPSSLYKSAYGRCGEESIFGAVIFRSMGIPARQAFAPLWAHCDDNHAWVEVWIDGEWKFLGACEPESVLNKGWFTNPSSRAMMIQSNWQLPVPSKESLLSKNASGYPINRLHTYAETTKLEVNVADQQGNPVSGVLISFSVFNYGSFGPIASLTSDAQGKAVLETGFGTILVSVRENDVITEMLVNTMEQSSCTIVLGTVTDKMEEWEDMTTIAPHATFKNYAHMTQEQMDCAQKRLNDAVEKRQAKVAGFYDEALAEKSMEGYSEEDKVRCREILKQACGNIGEIAAFLAKDPQGKYPTEWKLALLNSLAEKDYTDTSCALLEENCEMTAAYETWYEKEILYKYVLCPRVMYEHLRSFRGFVLSWLSEEQIAEYRTNPGAAWEMVRERLQVEKNTERNRLLNNAPGALEFGYGNEMSARVVCVQVLRSIGVAARINHTDGLLEAWKDGAFVTLEQRVDASAGRTATIIIHEQEGVEWQYHKNWLIARHEGHGYVPVGLPWEREKFDGTIHAFPGKFRVTTCNRLPSGNCLIKKFVFEIKDGETRDIYLQLTEATLEDMLEKNKITDFGLTKEDGTVCMASDLVKEQKGLFIWLQESKEPTEHVLNEMYEVSEAFEQLQNGKVYFIIKNPQVKEDPTLKHTLTKISNVEFLYDDFDKKMEQVAEDMHVNPGELPLVLVIDEQMNGIYGVAGYNVGAVNMVLRVLDAAK